MFPQGRQYNQVGTRQSGIASPFHCCLLRGLWTQMQLAASLPQRCDTRVPEEPFHQLIISF